MASGRSRVTGQFVSIWNSLLGLLSHSCCPSANFCLPPCPPACQPAGSDKFSSIGSPQVQLTPGALKAAADVAAVQQQWVAVVHGLFPPGPGKAQEQQGKVPPQLDARYREEDVDTARARREAALEAYRREMEAIHRQETAARKQKAAAAAAGGAGQGQQQQQAVARRAR